jgi:hypothetical protein
MLLAFDDSEDDLNNPEVMTKYKGKGREKKAQRKA